MMGGAVRKYSKAEIAILKNTIRKKVLGTAWKEYLKI